MASSRRLWPLRWILYPRGELGAWRFPSDAIGWGSGVLSTALWTKPSGGVGGVGNSLARSENEKVQFGCVRVRACLRRIDG
jgi:hypothetical protein